MSEKEAGPLLTPVKITHVTSLSRHTCSVSVSLRLFLQSCFFSHFFFGSSCIPRPWSLCASVVLGSAGCRRPHTAASALIRQESDREKAPELYAFNIPTQPYPHLTPRRDPISKSIDDPILGKTLKSLIVLASWELTGCVKSCNHSNELQHFFQWVYCPTFLFEPCHWPPGHLPK